MSDDEWGDSAPAPDYIAVARVVKDHIPENNKELTLILDDLVYIYKKSVPGKPGYWEGESLGVYGVFPSKNVLEQSKGDNSTRITKTD